MVNPTTSVGPKLCVSNLSRGLDIIELLQKHPDGLTLSDIMRELKISKNLAFRVTSLLLERGYLVRNPQTMLFRMSRKILTIGLATEYRAGIIDAAIPVLRKIRDETLETAALCVQHNSKGIVLYEVPSTHMMRLTFDPGIEYAVHASAQGKAMLAALPEEKAIAFLEKYGMSALTPSTLTTLDQFREEFRQIRKRGYAYDLQEQLPGVFCIGAAVLDEVGHPVAGICMVGPSFRIPPERYESIGELVRQGAKEISSRMGYFLSQ